MGLAKNEEELAARASAFLKAKLRASGVTYAELVKRLRKHGLKETEAGITMKLKRGTFSATFFLACLAAMELEGLVLEKIEQPGRYAKALAGNAEPCQISCLCGLGFCQGLPPIWATPPFRGN